MTYQSVVVLAGILLTTVSASQSRADDSHLLSSTGSQQGYITRLDSDFVSVRECDVVVFKNAADSTQSFIKRLATLPDEKSLEEGTAIFEPIQPFDTIKSQGSKIEITADGIRIIGGKVEISRTASPR